LNDWRQVETVVGAAVVCVLGLCWLQSERLNDLRWVEPVVGVGAEVSVSIRKVG